jgi:peptidoglycan/xylan/chitin deacetylase (PgdA/CDA1 family)
MNRSDFIKSLLAAGFLSAIPSAFSQRVRIGPGGVYKEGEKVSRALPVEDAEIGEAGTVEISNAKNLKVTTYPKFFTHADGFGRRIALSYDDGPTPGVTDKLLVELAKRDQKATFFMIGQKVKRNVSLVKEVHAAGHEIANHSFTHPFLTKLTHTQITDQLKRTQDDIAEVTGKAPTWFRPPYGDFNKSLAYIPESLGLGVVLWSLDTKDYTRPGAEVIAQRVKTGVVPGSIILLHDLIQQSYEASTLFLDYFKENSYRLATMNDILGDPYA